MLTVDFKQIPLRPGMRVLDAGCGGGRHLCEAFRTDGVEVAGVDLGWDDLCKASGYLSLMARESRGRWLISRADVTKLPFAEGVFDVVVCSGSWSMSRRAGPPFRSWSGSSSRAGTWSSPFHAFFRRGSAGRFRRPITTSPAATSGFIRKGSCSACWRRRVHAAGEYATGMVFIRPIGGLNASWDTRMKPFRWSGRTGNSLNGTSSGIPADGHDRSDTESPDRQEHDLLPEKGCR